MKRLAIIIPAYKENFLFETLQSLANQTNKDFNVYVGDDCSPYDLQSIVSRFEDRLDIHYVVTILFSALTRMFPKPTFAP